MFAEVQPAGFRYFESLLDRLGSSGGSCGIGTALFLATDVSLYVVVGLLDIAGYIKGVSGRFRDGQTDYETSQLVMNRAASHKLQ